MKISKRNYFYVELSKDSVDFWDVACDHGQAGFCALQTNRFKNIYLVDPVANIISNTKKIIEYQLDNLDQLNLFFICQKGQDIKEAVSGNFLMAGVGGELINQVMMSLLNQGNMGAERLIFSPYTDLKKIDLLQSDQKFQQLYKLSYQTFFTENKKQRQIFVFDKIL